MFYFIINIFLNVVIGWAWYQCQCLVLWLLKKRFSATTVHLFCYQKKIVESQVLQERRTISSMVKQKTKYCLDLFRGKLNVFLNASIHIFQHTKMFHGKTISDFYQ